MATKKKAVVQDDGVYVYLGPSIRGVIQYGSIYRGTRADVLSALSYAIEKYPKIKNLLVESAEIATAKEKIRSGGNLLAVSYKALKKNAD